MVNLRQVEKFTIKASYIFSIFWKTVSMKLERKKHPKNRIAYWRNLRGKTLEDVGQKLGIAKAAASHKEKGKSPVTLSDLYALSELFKCPPWQIVEEEIKTAEEIMDLIENSNEIAQQRFDDLYSGWKRRHSLKKIPIHGLHNSDQPHKGKA